MMEVSLVLSARQLHSGQSHLLSDSSISGPKYLERKELIFGDNGIVSMSNFSSLTGKQKHWLQEILILMVFEFKSLAATEVPFSSSLTNCSTSTASCWKLKLNGAWWDCEILWERAHKKFDGSTPFLHLDFIFVSRVIDFWSGDKDDDSDNTLVQSDGKALSTCRIAFV